MGWADSTAEEYFAGGWGDAPPPPTPTPPPPRDPAAEVRAMLAGQHASATSPSPPPRRVLRDCPRHGPTPAHSSGACVRCLAEQHHRDVQESLKRQHAPGYVATYRGQVPRPGETAGQCLRRVRAGDTPDAPGPGQPVPPSPPPPPSSPPPPARDGWGT